MPLPTPVCECASDSPIIKGNRSSIDYECDRDVQSYALARGTWVSDECVMSSSNVLERVELGRHGDCRSRNVRSTGRRVSQPHTHIFVADLDEHEQIDINLHVALYYQSSRNHARRVHGAIVAKGSYLDRNHCMENC